MLLIGFASFRAEDPHVCGDARGQGRFDGEEEGEVRLYEGTRSVEDFEKREDLQNEKSSKKA